VHSGLGGGLQSVCGSPMYPSGHVHLGSCRITLQDAEGAHGFSSAQGLMHFLFLHVFTDRGHCQTVEVKAECYVDDDCAYSDVCNEGSCINACRLLRCGNNAKCETGKHSARCICLPGYTGNAQTECSLFGLPTEPVLSVGCLQNEECPLYNACRNRKCINPCAEENPCAPSAYCKVIMHQPVCTCPDGYIGDPRTNCELRKYPNNTFPLVYFLKDDRITLCLYNPNHWKGIQIGLL
jgi:hypothetical protein